MFVLALRRNTLLDWSTTELELKDLQFTVWKTQISEISHGLVIHTEIQYCDMYPNYDAAFRVEKKEKMLP